MGHCLDNPIWHALRSGNAAMASGTGGLSYFAPDVAPFAGMEAYDDTHMQRLVSLAPQGRTLVIFSDKEVRFPDGLNVLDYIQTYQMVYEKTELPEPPAREFELRNLSREDVPQMLALTALTKPGPFFENTIDFGHYQGIFEGEKLVSMAGYRLHPDNYIEVSAVCTEPGALGKGYAGAILASRIRSIREEGCIPFLHVTTSNERAFQRYERSGFTIRKRIHIYLFSK